MGMFNMSATTGAKEGGRFLQAGIHNAKFVSVELSSIHSQNKNEDYKTMKLTVDIEGYGEFSHNFFEPTSDERTASQYGENPSSAEHFMISVRQIMDALDPSIGEMIDNKNVVIAGKKIDVENLTFDQLVKMTAYLTKSFAGTELEIKLLPQSNGFVDIPGFPAKVNRKDPKKLDIATRFIGHNLVLNQSEQKKVEAAKNAQPTNMAQSGSGSVEGLADTLGIDTTEAGSDLPF
jgi:hypothetical protein